MSKFNIMISSDLNYEDLVAEIYFNDKFVGLINQDDPQNLRFELPINCDEAAVASDIPLIIFLEALKVALGKLGYDKSSFFGTVQ